MTSRVSKISESRTNKLLELSSQLFALAQPFYRADKGLSMDDSYAEHIISAFDRFQRLALEAGLEMATIQHAKYALAAFMDEVIMRSSWSERENWMAQPLQVVFFGERAAGEGFFTRLSQLRQYGAVHIDLLEIYYVCLQLGFEGLYRMQGLEKLLALQVDLCNQIDSMRGRVDFRLAPEAQLEQSMLTKVTREIPFWVIGSVTLAAVLCIYLSFSVAINW